MARFGARTRPDLAIAQSKGVPFFLYDFTRTDLTFQEANGQTPADDAGEPVAVALSIDQIGGKTLAQVISAQPELRSSGAINTIGSATPATYNTSSGAGSATRVDGSNQSYIQFPVTPTSFYRIDIENLTVGVTLQIRDVPGGAISYNIAQLSRNSLIIPVTPTLVIVSGSNAATVSFIIHSIKEIPGNHAVQSGSVGLRPVRQAGGVVRFDSGDDNLLTALAGAAAGNAFIAKVTVPASLAATQVVAGFNAASNGRFQAAINTAGQICAGVGANSTTSHVGAVDHRGQTGVLAVIEDGANVKIYWNGVEEHSAARNGAPDAAVPYRVGSNNNNGTAANFFGGDIRLAEALKGAFLTPTEIAQISKYWNSSP